MSAVTARPVPGEGFLALHGGLGVLCAATGSAAEQVVALLDEVVEAGGDGTAWCDRLAATFPAARAPGLVAWGPVGSDDAVEVMVHGPAWADVATSAAEQRLVLRQAQTTALRAGVPGGLTSLTAGLGTPTTVEPTGPWRLDAGVVPASAVVVTAAEPTADPASVAPPVAAVQVVKPAHAAPDTAAPVVVSAPVVPPAPAMQAPTPVATPPEEEPAPTSVEPIVVVPDGTPAPSPVPVVDRELPFSSVLFVGAGAAEPSTVAPAAAPLPVSTQGAGAQNVAHDTRPVILGVYCKNGHFDDPAARYCAICGISMQQQTLYPRPGPRPPLGVLILDDGSIFSLDADYVLGREPTVHPDVRSSDARPLRVGGEAGHVSRAHVRVTLDGWHVTVTDLKSANGTGVSLPKQTTWQRLEPGRPFTLVPSTRVALGRREIRYESHRNT